MIVITSAAFISSEFQVELGRLPPALLPIGNKRLCEYQVALLRSQLPGQDIYLSITDAHPLRTTDEILLKRLGVNIVTVPDGLSLGHSLLYVINSVGVYDNAIRILHGDTLLSDIPAGDDVVAIAEAEDEYPWEVETDSEDSERVWCGYFAFSDLRQLARCLSAARGGFVEAVRAYQASHALSFPMVQGWLDMGHVNNYFRARGTITTERSFNQLRIVDGVVRKSSSQDWKISAEAQWFASIPHQIRRYIPQLIHYGDEGEATFYELEYLPYLPLNELFVHGNLTGLFWRKIFNLADGLLGDFYSAVNLDDDQRTAIRQDFANLIVAKTETRLHGLAATLDYDIGSVTSLNGQKLPSVRQMVMEAQSAALSLPERPGVVHGDFCFSNILYDSRANTLKVLDPRGINAEGEITFLGDLKYDVAKFVHSLIGLYDHIVAGLFTLTEDAPLQFDFEIHVDKQIESLQHAFGKGALLGITATEIMPVVLLLFVSMIPLHSDNPRRQRAFLANVLRLYTLWKK